MQECVHLIYSLLSCAQILSVLFLKWNKCIFSYQRSIPLILRSHPLSPFQGFLFSRFTPFILQSTSSMSFSALDHSRQIQTSSVLSQIIIIKFSLDCHDSLCYISLFFHRKLLKILSQLLFTLWLLHQVLNHSLNLRLSRHQQSHYSYHH